MNRLTLAYAIPSKFTRLIGIESCRFNVTGQNLFSFYNPYPDNFIDPMTSYGSYPTLRKFTIGVNVTFKKEITMKRKNIIAFSVALMAIGAFTSCSDEFLQDKKNYHYYENNKEPYCFHSDWSSERQDLRMIRIHYTLLEYR